MTNLASIAWAGDHLVANRMDGGKVTATRIQSEIVVVDFSSVREVPAGAMCLDDFLDGFDQHPEVAAHLPAARRDIAASRHAEGHKMTLSSLRLAKGLSQKQLADMIDTKQPMLSLIENRQQKPREDTLRALSAALEVDFNTLMEALANG